MAEIRKVVPSNPISSFRSVAPSGGVLFGAIADLANVAYERLAPAAVEQMKAEGAEAGREMARQVIGENRPLSLAAPRQGEFLTEGQKVADDTMRALGYPPSDRELLAKTLQAEAGGEGLEGMIAAGAVIANRVADGGYGEGVQGVIMKPAQFSAWNGVTGAAGGAGAIDMDNLRVSQDAYRAADMILSGNYQDPTGGATHYYNPAAANPDWGQRAGGNWLRIGNHVFGRADGGGARQTSVSSKSEPPAAGEPPAGGEPVLVRTSENRVEPRLYSPLAGPILQAHNAAAQIAYNAEILNQASVDLFDLSTQHESNPEGFFKAAEGYVDQMVQSAPSSFRAELRTRMDKVVQQRFLGMVEERHRDIRQRAINSSGALMNRYQDELAEAYASGDPDEIAQAERNLNDILTARESLPGLAWTGAQSDNVRIGAREASEAIRKKQQESISKEVADQYKLAIEALNAGMSPADEAFLMDPRVQEMSPELARDFMAWKAFNEAMPGFASGTPAEMAAGIAALRNQPVSDDIQIDMLKKAEAKRSEVLRDWNDDPMAAASKYLPEKPPALPSPADPGYAAALSARRDYARRLVDEGYVPDAAIFTKGEAQELTPLLSLASPPEARMALAGQIVMGLGEDAPLAFRQLKAGDKVTLHAGQLIARGGDPAVALEAMQGQQILKENLVTLPPKADRLAAYDPETAQAISVLPGAIGIQAQVMEFAKAIYAARAQGVAPDSQAAVDLMQQAVQVALGQGVDPRGRTIGGVQEVTGHPVLLPPSLAGEDVNAALVKAMTPPTSGNAISRTAEAIMAPFTGGPSGGTLAPFTGGPSGGTFAWIEATDVEGQAPSLPYAAGAPLPRSVVTGGQTRLIPVGGNVYRMEVVRQGASVPVEAADGKMLLVDIEKLIQATQ